MKNVPVALAAYLMGKSQQSIRIGLQRRLLPFGVAIETKPGRYTYYISPIQFEAFTGINPDKERKTR